jgi:hypothetical protein
MKNRQAFRFPLRFLRQRKGTGERASLLADGREALSQF